MSDSGHQESEEEHRPLSGDGTKSDVTEAWVHDLALIRAVLDGDSKALKQLFTEKLDPVLAAQARGCPKKIAGRYYDDGCKELSRIVKINKNGELSRDAWTTEVSRIQISMESKLRSAEWDWLRVTMALNGSTTAEDELLKKYEPFIVRLARRFQDRYPEILDDMIQEGRIVFRERVILEYNPDRGVAIWEFAAIVLKRKMYSVGRQWAKPRIAQPLYRRVTAAEERLRKKHPERQLTPEEIATECKDSVNDVLLVLEFGPSRKVISLKEGWDESPIESYATHLGNPTSQRIRYEDVVRCLNNWRSKGADGDDGVRWLVLFILKDCEEYGWDRILALLEGRTSINWSLVHETYTLPFSVPADWQAIRHLFGSKILKLTEANLRKWHSRRSEVLKQTLNRVDLDVKL